jgi:hypothetical protein
MSRGDINAALLLVSMAAVLGALIFGILWTIG